MNHQPMDPQNEHTTFRNATFANGVPVPPPVKTQKMIFSLCDTLFAWLSLAVGFVLARALPVTENTLAGVLLVVLLFAFGGIYLGLSGVRLGRKSIFFAVGACLLSVGLVTGANHTLQGTLFFLLLLSFLYWVYRACGLGGKHVADGALLLNLWYALVANPVLSVIYFFPGLIIRDKKSRGKKMLLTAAWLVIGLFCAVLPTAIIILLLSYDAGFMALLKQIFSFSLLDALELIWDGIVGLVLAVLLYGVLYGSNRRRVYFNEEGPKSLPFSTHVLPKALLCATVTPILLVYVVFFISQWDYYISAFTGVLPENMTYAAYAREGFFQLCIVCTINAVMLLLFQILVKRNAKKRDPVRAAYAVAISVFTLVLIATALSKMLLYIDSYGLTPRRVYASWLILLLACFFVAVLLRQCLRRFPLIRVMAITFVLFFALISLPDVDGLIANYNVEAYLSGKLEQVDVETAAEYDASSVPALIRLKGALEEKESLTNEEARILADTDRALYRIAKELKEVPDHMLAFNIPIARAKALLMEWDLYETDNS